MRNILCFLVVAAWVIAMAWAIPPAAQAQRGQETELVKCCVGKTGKCEGMTRKACLNAGGKVVENCDKCEKGK